MEGVLIGQSDVTLNFSITNGLYNVDGRPKLNISNFAISGFSVVTKNYSIPQQVRPLLDEAIMSVMNHTDWLTTTFGTTFNEALDMLWTGVSSIPIQLPAVLGIPPMNFSVDLYYKLAGDVEINTEHITLGIQGSLAINGSKPNLTCPYENILPPPSIEDGVQVYVSRIAIQCMLYDLQQQHAIDKVVSQFFDDRVKVNVSLAEALVDFIRNNASQVVTSRLSVAIRASVARRSGPELVAFYSNASLFIMPGLTSAGTILLSVIGEIVDGLDYDHNSLNQLVPQPYYDQIKNFNFGIPLAQANNYFRGKQLLSQVYTINPGIWQNVMHVIDVNSIIFETFPDWTIFKCKSAK